MLRSFQVLDESRRQVQKLIRLKHDGLIAWNIKLALMIYPSDHLVFKFT